MSRPDGPYVDTHHAQPARTVLASIVQLYIAFGVKHGILPSTLCAAAGIDERQIAVGDVHVPYRWLWLVRRAIIERLPQRVVGLEFGLFFTPDQFGYLGQALKHVETAYAALALWNQLTMHVHRGLPKEPSLRKASNLGSSASVHARHGLVYWELPKLPDEQPEALESLFVSTVASFRTLTLPSFSPQQVYFERTNPAHRAAFEAFFGAPVQTGYDHCMMVFDADTLNLPLVHADVSAARNFRDQFEQRTGLHGDSFGVSVECAVRSELRSGGLSQQRVAKLLGMTTRTFQRKCRERGVRYQERVARARKAAALELLADRSLNVHEIASAIGYDVSSFNRVFRRWTGMSPSAFRKGAQLGLGGASDQRADLYSSVTPR